MAPWEDPLKRKAYLDSLQVWLDGNQTLLLSRQANCFEPAYATVFGRHLEDEFGHGLLKKAWRVDHSEPKPRDPILEATTNWFAYQMYLLDNSEKAALMYLVIETASAAYHKQAQPVLARYAENHSLGANPSSDLDYAALGQDLLRNESPRTYARLRQITGEAWDMIGAMTDRVVELTLSA